MRKANRFLPSVLLFMILPVLLNTACGSSKYTVAFSEYTLPFVTVREADFRCGPLDLPLTDECRRMISTFLQRGGNWGNEEMLDLPAPTYYDESGARFKYDTTMHGPMVALEVGFGQGYRRMG